MCNTKKLVSIIVPAYNVENYIDRCLESILAQTYSEIEILVVDDGSKDNTWNHIESFMKKDERVKGFRRENVGVSATRNFAIEIATGYYLQFVDADDYLRNDAVEIMVNAIESSGASWVNCQYNRIDEADSLLEPFNFTKGIKHTETPEARFKLIRDELLEYFIGFEVWDKLFITSIIKDNHLRFDENCHLGEDLAFNICYGFYASSINCIEDRIYYYLIRENSAMENAKSLEKNFREHLALVKGIEPRFNQVFSGELKDKFYQLFYKLMLHGFWRHNAEEALQLVKEVNDEYYYRYLIESLKHKDEFKDFYCKEKVRLYYRYGLYIDAYVRDDLCEKIYLSIYDIYRKLRKWDTIREWQLS